MKKIFKKINNFLNRIFDKAYQQIKNNSHIAVKITQMLKIFVESGIADKVVNIIPSEYDDAVLAALKLHIPRIAFHIALVHGIMQESENGNDAVARVVEYLQKLNPQARVGFWITFASELNIALNDGKLDYTEAVILTQLAYKEFYQ